MADDKDIESHILEAYRPLTRPDGHDDWTVLGPYSVVFRLVDGQREVWAETPLKHFSRVASGVQVDIKGYSDTRHTKKDYYYGSMGGGLTRRIMGQPSTPMVRFGNATEARWYCQR